MHTSSRDQHLEMITVSTNGTPILPDGDQLAAYLASVGQIPGMATYTVTAALQAVWEWGYQAAQADAVADALSAWDGTVQPDPDGKMHYHPQAGSTESKFMRTDGE